MRDHLLRGNLIEFARLLDKAWRIKKTLSKKISNKKLDIIYENAIKNGALGGKLLGAGGGGFFLFFVPPFKKFNLIEYLQSEGLSVMPFVFEKKGLKSWVSRFKKYE